MDSRPRISLPLLLLGLALCAAGASAEDLDAVPPVDGTSLDAVESDSDGEPLDRADSDGEPLDRADSGDDGTPLGEVPDVGPAVPDLQGSVPLDAAPNAQSLPLDRAERDRGWRPTPCSELTLELPPAPAPSDAGAWRAALREVRDSVRSSRVALERADAAYSRSLTSHEPLGEARAEIIEARDRARSDYSRARCAMPAWLERARRAGVEPGVLRSVNDG